MKAILPVDMEMLDILCEFSQINDYILFTSFENRENISNFRSIDSILDREDSLEKVDEVIIIDTEVKLDKTVLSELICKIVQKEIKITFLSTEYRFLKDKLNDIRQHNKAQITFLDENINNKNINPYESIGASKLLDIETPIVCVMGVGDNVQKMKLQVYLQNKFFKEGYKSILIGSDNVSLLMDQYVIPPYIMNEEFSSVEKIKNFNKFIKNVEKMEKPDIIILGIPGGIMPFDKKHNFSFGIWAYEILSAVNPDVCLLSLFSGNYNDEFYKTMEELCRYRFNVDLDGFYISQFAPVSNTLLQEEISYAFNDAIYSYSQEYSVYYKKDLDELYNMVISNLELYGNFKHF